MKKIAAIVQIQTESREGNKSVSTTTQQVYIWKGFFRRELYMVVNDVAYPVQEYVPVEQEEKKR